jgi:Flp pilus assembly protein TadG
MGTLRKITSESGQALTEFAVVMPLLFVLIFAIVEGGVMMNNYLQLTDAVRVAARTASVHGSEGQTAATAAATSALTDAAGSLGLKNVQVAPVDLSKGWQSGYPVSVQASVHYSVTLPLFGTVMSGDLTSRSIQRIE